MRAALEGFIWAAPQSKEITLSSFDSFLMEIPSFMHITALLNSASYTARAVPDCFCYIQCTMAPWTNMATPDLDLSPPGAQLASAAARGRTLAATMTLLEQLAVSQVQPGTPWVAAAQPQVQVLSAQVRPCDRKLLIYSYAAPRFGLFFFAKF